MAEKSFSNFMETDKNLSEAKIKNDVLSPPKNINKHRGMSTVGVFICLNLVKPLAPKIVQSKHKHSNIQRFHFNSPSPDDENIKNRQRI